MSKNLQQYLRTSNHWLLIIIGSIVWSLTMVKSGLTYKFGMGFWGPNGHDGVWHLSLVESLSEFSLQMPVFAGESLKNYHLGFDLLLAAIHVVSRIPVRGLYFQLMPPLLAAGIGYIAWKFLLAWTKSKSAALWGLFFVYFGGSLGWLVNLIRGQGWGGESMFWAQQSISTLINPPFALSLLVIFYVLYRLVSFSKQTTNYQLLTTSLLIGSLAFIKIYAAILFLPGLAMAAFWDRKLFKLLILSCFFSLLFYLPFNRGASSLIVFQPFWFLENMLALSDRFFWPRLYQAMIVYKTTRNFIKFFPAYALATLIFLIGNFGLRVLGLLKIQDLKKPDTIMIILWTMASLGFIFPLLVLQQGTPWNTIQFFYYSQFILGLFTAILISQMAKKFTPKLFIVSCTLITIFTLPTTLDTLRHYLPSQPPAMISHEELAALNFLSRQPSGVVFTPPAYPNPYAPAPRPLYLYESTAYVSAFSRHPVYLEDTVNLNITGYPWQNRLELADNFMTTTNLASAIDFLDQNFIHYLYLPQVAKTRPVFSASELGGEVIFENSQTSIWQIK